MPVSLESIEALFKNVGVRGAALSAAKNPHITFESPQT